MADQILYRRHYRAIVVDFPWRFKAGKSNRSVENHYPTMSYNEILALAAEMRELAHPDGCHVFCWTTGPFLEKTFPVLKAMGAKYSSVAFYYLKMKKKFGTPQIELTTTAIKEIESLFHVGTGLTTRKNIEPCLLAKIGKPKRRAKDVRELIIDPLREHSRKPDETLRRVERFCEGPYLEMFSRSSRRGWTHFGDEIGKFDAAVASDLAAE